MDTATFVTVIGLWMVLIFGAIAIFLTYRNRRAALEMSHRERMSALERGLDLPAPAVAGRDLGGEYLRRGVVCLAVGFALMAALAVNAGLASAAWALPLIGFGGACLVIYRVEIGRGGSGGAGL